MSHRDQRDTSLASLRMLIVADGANPCEYARNTGSVNLDFKKHQYFEFFCHPGSVSSCDAFLNVFQSHGLKAEVVCPCATSPEAMTVAIRRYQINTIDTR